MPLTARTHLRLSKSRIALCANPSRSALPVILVLALIGVAAPTTAQDSGEVRTRQQQMAERREQRQKAARELREQSDDPDFIRAKAWWNDEANMSALDLTSRQRAEADTALARFLERRTSLQEVARTSKQEFFDALGSDAKELPQKKWAMLEATAASGLANADFRIKVLAILSPKQRASLVDSMPQILRSNWTRPSDLRQRMQRRSRQPTNQNRNHGP